MVKLKGFSRAVVAGLGLLLIVGGFAVLANQPPRLKLGGQVFHYKLADTPAEQQQGLSGRDGLPSDQAMLFTLTQSEQVCFWMKDMRFSLDIIWLNDQKQVVYIKENATPESYPERFCPDKSARYVVEVNTGVVQSSGLKIGDQAEF